MAKTASILRLACVSMVLLPAAGIADTLAVWAESFAGGRLDPERWQVTSAGDFRDRRVAVDELPRGSLRYRLALGIDTRSTKDETVKVLGVRSIPRFAIAGGTCVSLDLDWNGQENGSYLTAAAVLSPDETSGDVLARPDWLKVEYVGVPPGGRARMVVGVRQGGRDRTLHDEGWPERNRAGRPIGLQRLTIALRHGRLEVRENGARLYASEEPVVLFRESHLYLRVSSHSNYPLRTVRFGDIRVERSAPGPAAGCGRSPGG